MVFIFGRPYSSLMEPALAGPGLVQPRQQNYIAVIWQRWQMTKLAQLGQCVILSVGPMLTQHLLANCMLVQHWSNICIVTVALKAPFPLFGPIFQKF
jgi:hypothetical protein